MNSIIHWLDSVVANVLQLFIFNTDRAERDLPHAAGRMRYIASRRGNPSYFSIFFCQIDEECVTILLNIWTENVARIENKVRQHVTYKSISRKLFKFSSNVILRTTFFLHLLNIWILSLEMIFYTKSVIHWILFESLIEKFDFDKKFHVEQSN